MHLSEGEDVEREGGCWAEEGGIYTNGTRWFGDGLLEGH